MLATDRVEFLVRHSQPIRGLDFGLWWLVDIFLIQYRVAGWICFKCTPNAAAFNLALQLDMRTSPTEVLVSLPDCPSVRRDIYKATDTNEIRDARAPKTTQKYPLK